MVTATTPSGGAWESTCDIWASNYANEIMVWKNYGGTSAGCGNVKPISYNWSVPSSAIPVYTNVTAGDGVWNAYRGNYGRHMVYSFLRTSKANNASA